MGLTIAQVAEQVPATPETVGLIEDGEILDNISDQLLGALAGALDVETSRLRGLKDRGLSTSEMPAFYGDCAIKSTGRLFHSLSFADAPSVIPYLPIPNTYTHPTFGKVEITKEGNRLFVENFNKGVYQERIPIDAEHETKISGAMGWITMMMQNTDGSVDARVEWTDRGLKMIESDRFKFFSPEWFSIWRDPVTDKTHKNVAIGGALTTRPFFKEKALRPLIANEMGVISMATRIGDFIASKRNEMGMSQGELANQLPITVSTLGQIERGDIETPSQPVLRALADALDTTLSRLRGLLPEGANPLEEVSRNNETTKEKNTMSEQLDERLTALESSLGETQEKLQASEAEKDALQKQAQSFAEQNKQLAERIIAMEQAAQSKRFSELIRNESRQWAGSQASHESVLNALAQQYGEDSDQFKAYVQDQNGLAEQLSNSQLFNEIGSSAGGKPANAEQQLEIEAKKLFQASEGKMTFEQAYTQATLANPDLYDRYMKETGGRS